MLLLHYGNKISISIPDGGDDRDASWESSGCGGVYDAAGLGMGWFCMGYALLWFLLNDRIKLLAYRILDPAGSRKQSTTTPSIKY